jgi:hypothetical protein
VGLKRGPLNLVSTIKELLGRKISGSGQDNWEYGRTDPSHWPCSLLSPQKLALTSPTSGGHSAGIVHLGYECQVWDIRNMLCHVNMKSRDR